MKRHTLTYLLSTVLIFAIFSLSFSDLLGQKKKKHIAEKFDTLNLSTSTGDYNLQLTFLKGKAHNYPTFAIWLEDMDGEYIETLFVTQYFATGIFGHADAGDGKWELDAGEAIRPAALPYWSRKRSVISRDSIYAPTPENPLPDAISGATPVGSFVLNTTASLNKQQQFRILMEINQTWDWNDYWTNNKYPDDKNYKTSAQPSLIYEAIISPNETSKVYQLKAIGHGHYSGKNGELFADISTLSTALNIAKEIEVTLLTQN